MRKLFLISLFCLCFAGVWAQSNVTLSTSDGWAIASTFYQGESKKCAILLHDLEKSRAEFGALTERLRNQKFCYLSIDLRGTWACARAAPREAKATRIRIKRFINVKIS
ncbi:MAG: hypothetical protein II183_00950, partial [Elusimicrobiaceae bacterium]|nr:hypothetical protein [Elusimicrobiaceae bacterium]